MKNSEGLNIRPKREKMPRKTQAVISLSNIKSNYLLANNLAPQSKNIAIIKADAYGHGLQAVAKCLDALVPAFGVAIIDEAITLREAGITKNILLLQGVTSKDEVELAFKHNLWLSLHSPQQLDLILSVNKTNEALNKYKPLKLWLKVDTGMHRLGLDQNQLIAALESIKQCPWIGDDYVVSSHFSCANELGNDESNQQIKRFNSILEKAKVSKSIQLSFSNSSALVNIPKVNLDWNRPGIMLYGLPLFDGKHASDNQLKPAMSFESEVIALRDVKPGDSVGYGKGWTANKDSKIATIAVGYADGYPKQAKNGTPVLVNGKRAKLVGAVSMDLITVDVTEIGKVTIGDKVELWGVNLCANEVAAWSGTIGYDLVAGVGFRVPRVYY